jgi:hypothetical protein
VSFERKVRVLAGFGAGKIQKEHAGGIGCEIKGALQIGGCGFEVASMEQC